MTSKMIQKLLIVCGLGVMTLSFTANAQIAASTNELSSPIYDLSKEIKIQGTIEKISTISGNGLIGTHLLVATGEGVIDIHLGASMAVSAKSLGLSVGESVNLTGMMASINSNSVLLARILTTSTRVYVLRNELGVPVRSLMPRGAASSANTQKGAL
ncbi:MAG TPA: hypothetical protein VK795_08810 [Terriglobales bacterium]|nr:hypothetical protein [Terriglobales bacterium]